jgi:hypothetical protein
MLVDVLSDQDDARRIVLSYENILLDLANVFRKGGFYASAPAGLRAAQCFPQAWRGISASPMQLSMIQTLRQPDGPDYGSLLTGSDPARRRLPPACDHL